ncbi:MAG: acyl-CoA dehydrogenase [Rhodospirillaceae bacterium]|nr:acyl-CoA dehydrogenase [Rhodospirillaceae bacterium]MBT6206169.1 acyl-CoA dehydrogenase [Rhodospirillaceae bacterium]MBT6513099.1 acyl-CoA dehydrogenase [Rhodospirillaceae bacterium]MBT7613311.1 acyl-CoA dehydrogenase [Rhodospirillaceae bacterium]MBT7649171.1 acyl-CoA dehydrogenase [Rhodospirillaceae bacterium]
MTEFSAPVDDIRFALEAQADFKDLAGLWDEGALDDDLVTVMLSEAGKLASEVMAPLNRQGDLQGGRLENGVVRLPDGFEEAFDTMVEGGWMGLSFPEEHGGQDLPWTLALAVQEMFEASNMSLSLSTLLTKGAIELLLRHGTQEQKAAYLPNMIAGTWSGTMNLTEPQAGTDLALLRSRAERADDGSYRITGQKIFITYGDHEAVENIIHLVLARLPDAPPGIRGISLFVVPKYLLREDGTPGERNDLRAVSLEKKLGAKGSPTCVMAYGDNGGATGFLVGEEHKGLACMFTMMNNARIAVGLQGLAIGERARQQACTYASERVQGQRNGAPVTIDQHPDVARMLAWMTARTEATRGLIFWTAACFDRAERTSDADEARRQRAFFELLTPVVKSWATDGGVSVASEGVQVHGGMGFIEETGAAQHYRDARILPIYEGTNGIQAIDLVGRKVARDGGATASDLFEMIDVDIKAARSGGDDDLADAVTAGLDHLRRTTTWVAETMATDQDAVLAGATSYQRLFGTVAGGWQLLRQASAAKAGLADDAYNAEFLEAKRETARFYMRQEMPLAGALAAMVAIGSS